MLEQGWTDALAHLHSNERIYSFWKYWRHSFEQDAGLRVDHILLNDKAAARLVSAEVDQRPRGWEKTRDHAPVIVNLADKPRRKRKA